MKRLLLITTIILTILLSGCTQLSYFYIINKTTHNIIITYTLQPDKGNDCGYALEDSVIFHNLNSGEAEHDEIIGKQFNQGYSKQLINGVEKYTVIVFPNTVISSSHPIYCSFQNFAEKHRLFQNIIEMKIKRLETMDTMNFTPSIIASVTRGIGNSDIALIFE